MLCCFISFISIIILFIWRLIERFILQKSDSDKQLVQTFIGNHEEIINLPSIIENNSQNETDSNIENDSKITNKKYAYVTLVMLGDAYVPGALVAAKSLRDTGTKNDLICMVTSDVSESARDALQLYYDKVVDVDYLSSDYTHLASQRLRELYSSWIKDSFTKWRCLELVQYDKVLFIDADLVFMNNIDDLFELEAPAGIFTHPDTMTHKRIHNAFGSPQHRQLIPHTQIQEQFDNHGFMPAGSLLLLSPNRDDFNKLKEIISDESFNNYKTHGSGADEVSITLLYHKLGINWHAISPDYLHVSWKHSVDSEVKVLHMFGQDKPWKTPRDKYPDLANWWNVADKIVIEHPNLETYFTIKK